MALGAASCSDVTAAVVLSLIETVLQLPGFGPALLQPHLQCILEVLQARIQGPGSSATDDVEATSAAVVQRGSTGGRGIALRALGIVELLSEQLCLEEHGIALACALLPVLQSCACRHHAPSSELTAARALRVLCACWRSVQGGTDMPGDTLDAFLRVCWPAPCRSIPLYKNPCRSIHTCVGVHTNSAHQLCTPTVHTTAQALASLTGSLSDRPARAALCDVVTALASHHPPLAPVAALLPALNAWDATTVEDIDYQVRLDAYGRCRSQLWTTLAPLPCGVLLQQCFRDLRNADDLSLRQAAATALEAAIDAAPGNAVLEGLLPVVVYGQLKRGLPATSLAVRQEHVLLLRRCVVAAPGAFEGLHVLVDDDVEVDFFHNVAHLQLHRYAVVVAFSEDTYCPVC